MLIIEPPLHLLCVKGKMIAACEGVKYLHPLLLLVFPSLLCEAQGGVWWAHQCRAAGRGSPPSGRSGTPAWVHLGVSKSAQTQGKLIQASHPLKF